MEPYSFTAAFLSGLLGAGHCVGMCGGLNGGFFAARSARLGLPPIAIYHLSRIAMYTLLGVGGAVAGRLLMQTGFIGKVQGIVMMLAGILIVLIGFRQYFSRPSSSTPTHVLNYVPNPQKPHMPAIIGIANGLVPCGLASTVAIQAAASGDALTAAGLMLVFGLGTLPAMVLLSVFGGYLGLQGQKARVLLLIGLLGLGAWTFQQGFVFFDVIRGLGNW